MAHFGVESEEWLTDSAELTECPHDSGHQVLQFDADGCWYYVWVCDACHCELYDDTL